MKGTKITDSQTDDYKENIDRPGLLMQMAMKGYEVLEPESNQVFLDLDTEEDYVEFKSRLRRFEDWFRITTNIEEYYSKSGHPHRHVIVTIPFDLLESEQIALQMALNSDPTREFLFLMRYLDGQDRPNVLFRKREVHF